MSETVLTKLLTLFMTRFECLFLINFEFFYS